MSNRNMDTSTPEMDMTQNKDYWQQRLAEIKRSSDEQKNRNVAIQKASNDVRNTNMQTRRRDGLDQVDICTMALSQNEEIKCDFSAFVTVKKSFQPLKESDDKEIKQSIRFIDDVNKMMNKFDDANLPIETAKLDKNVADIEKKVTERRNQVAKLVNEKKSAQARLDRTKQKCSEKMFSLVNKKSEVKLKLMSLKMDQALRARK